MFVIYVYIVSMCHMYMCDGLYIVCAEYMYVFVCALYECSMYVCEFVDVYVVCICVNCMNIVYTVWIYVYVVYL